MSFSFVTLDDSNIICLFAVEMIDQIIKKLGYQCLADTLEVSRTAVVNAKRNKAFPAAWFNVIEQLCKHHKIDCPRELFNWRGAAEITPLERITPKTNTSQNTHGTAA